VEQLLNHTSGIKSYTGMPEWMGKWRTDVSLDELIALFKDQPMEFAPGERWEYNNSAYVLAGAIIEKATGQSYGAFLAERVFGPLGMAHSSYDQTARVVRGRVAGYQKGPEGFENAPYLSMTWPHAAGGLMSSVDDLLLWDEALYTERLVPRALLERAFTPARLNDGTTTGYGYGWEAGAYNGRRAISHGGGINGFVTYALRLPDEHVFVAVLMNATGLEASPALLAVKLAGLALGEPFQAPQGVAVAPEVLEAYTGVYDEREKTAQTVTREGGSLYVQWSGGSREALVPLSESEFVLARDPLVHLRFVRDAAGGVAGLEVHNPLGMPVGRSTRTDKPLPTARPIVVLDPATLDRYAGDYEMAPGLMLVVRREGERLLAQLTGQPGVELLAESPLRFFLKEVDAQLEFTVEEGGGVTGVVLHQGGRDLPARKIR
jgi:hypothetical protein